MGNPTSLHTALQAAINTPGAITKTQLVTLLKRFPEPEVPAEQDLVIVDGVLSVDLRECNCAAPDYGVRRRKGSRRRLPSGLNRLLL